MLIDELLCKLHLETNSVQRQHLESLILDIQRRDSSFNDCSAWLQSSDASFQFFAAQTLLWHVRERWGSIKESREDLLQYTLSAILQSARPLFVQKKLIQVLAVVIINSHPTADFLCAILNQQAPLSVTLMILTELPLELDKCPSLSASQYAFKHHLNEHSDRISCLLEQSFDPNFPEWQDCFSAWVGFRTFRSLAIDVIVPKLISTMEQSSSILITWLESGVEDLPLFKLIHLFIEQRHHVRQLLLEPIEASVVAKVYRLYGELVVDQLVLEMPIEFLEIIMAFTQAEYYLNDPPVADVSLFWVDFCDAAIRAEAHLDDSAPRTSIRANFLQNLLVGLLSSLTKTPFTKEYLTYRRSLEKVICQIYLALQPASTMLPLLLDALSSNDARTAEVVIWTCGAVSSLVRPGDACFPALLKKSQCYIKPFPKTVLGTWIEAANILKADHSLLAEMTTIAFNLLAGKSASMDAVRTLEALACPETDELLLKSVHVLSSLSIECQLKLWPLICDAVGRRPHSRAMFLELIQFVYPMVARQPEPLLAGVIMLETLLKQCKEVSDCLSLLQLCSFQSSCADPALPMALANLWVSVMERHSKNSLVQNLMTPWVPEIISSLDPNGLRILEALIISDPTTAGVLGFLLNTDEAAWPNIIPLVICCLKSGPISSHAIEFVSRVVNGIYNSKSINDDYLRLSIKLATLTISTLDHSQKQSLFQCLLNISRNVLPSQIL
ncbi:hypothetical protein PSACC_03176 [Paramicrosporidium saccamoebae]|uniref:Importin N-terminal domain-containing protein n=1 Tax=Paramicrosporidium saccamoebae TaxID=1246581 RepID=A0A2H9TGV5_9FUNG|nr:hypothetical protein PSACC_03176 [Paramicrosporidium saccamoebae]